MKYRFIHKVLTVAMIVACVALVSCVNDADPCADEPQPVPDTPARVGDLWLSVDLRNQEPSGRRASASRASKPDDADNHPEEEAVEAENYVDTSDLNIMLLDNNRRVIRSFGSDDYRVSRQRDGVYRLTLKVHTDYFAYAGKEPTDVVAFSLLVLANVNGMSGADGAFGEGYMFNTIEQLSEAYRGFPYTGLTGENAPWTPSTDTEQRLIPMAGVAAMSVTRARLNAASTEADPIELADIYIQRSMAKVRLVDALEANGQTRLRIEGATLVGANSRGAYLPLLTGSSEWAAETAEVEYGTARSEWWNASAVLPSTKVSYTDLLNYVGKGADKVYDAYRIYVPEFDWDALADGVSGPVLRVQVRDTQTDEILYFDYAFPRTDPQITGGDADFARNHIYQVVVTGINYPVSVSLQLQYAVCPWSVHEIDIPPFN